MKISYIILLLGLVLGLSSCKDDKKVENNQNKSNKKDSAIVEGTKNMDAISLVPVQEVPKYTNKEANEFVNNTKLYFEQIAEATQKGETHKILELQLKAADVDTEFQKVKEKLNPEEQEQLINWYMKLVYAASK